MPNQTMTHTRRDNGDSVTKTLRLPGRVSVTVPAPSTVTSEPMMFYAGLTALGVIGLLEWPVAMAVGAAHYLARTPRDEHTE